MAQQYPKYAIRLAERIKNSVKTDRKYLFLHRNELKKHYSSVNTDFVQRHGVTPIHSSMYSHYIVAQLSPEEIFGIRTDSEVVSVSEFSELRLVPNETDIISRQVSFDSISGSHAADNAVLGNGVNIGVISAQNLTYIESSAQLRGLSGEGKIVYLGGDTAAQPSLHSSIVTSIIVGKSIVADGNEYRGVSPESRVYFVPSFSAVEVYEAIEKCIDNGAVIINYSAGEASPDGKYGDFDRQIDTLIYNTGILFVTSAGNSLYVSSPATSYNCVAVGNARTKSSPSQPIAPPYEMLCISQDDCSAYVQAPSLANKPDIAAPGTYVHYIDGEGRVSFGYYGTSFAAPYVTGIAAQIAENFPESRYNPIIIKALLLCGADGSAIKSDNNPLAENDYIRIKSGAGLVNSMNSLYGIQYIFREIVPQNFDTYTADVSVYVPSGGTLRACLCYYRPTEEIQNGRAYCNVVLNIVDASGNTVGFSDSINENVKLTEYFSKNGGEYRILMKYEDYGNTSAVPTAMAVRVI